MADQLALTAPGSGGKEMPVQAKLLARKTDPETSKAAAKEVTPERLGRSLRRFLSMLREHGCLTCSEAAYHYDPHKADYWQVEWCKRVNGWWHAGHIQPTGEVRDGSRVWELAP